MQKYRFLESCLFLPTYLNKKKLKDSVVGKTVLITGASSGIGEQLVYQLANIPCQLIIVARSGEKLSEIKDIIAANAAEVSIYEADLRNEEERVAFITFLHDLPNGIDIVVSNAGLSIRRSIFASLDRYHDFTRTMAINYLAPVHILLSTIPILERNRGQIINVSTVNALLAPVPYFAAYQASKFAFDVWLRSAAPELQGKGIATTTIYLPLVKTPMIKPTKEYRNIPAMSANHAAKIICKSMYTKTKKHQPWWLIFGQIASVFVRNFSGFLDNGGK